MDNKIGGMIYILRKQKGLTQDELGNALSVSGTAVSKWERGISYPDMEVLCKIADYFQVSTDELFGRNLKKAEEISGYSSNKIDAMEAAVQLMECYRLSRAEGLLAVEQKAEREDLHAFLQFCIKKMFEFYRKEIPQSKIENLLYNYCKGEDNRENAEMIAEAVLTMFEGVSEHIMIEVIASHLGREYYDRFALNVNYNVNYNEYSREKILNSYTDKKEEVNLLEELADYSDDDIAILIRNIDNVTFANALSGASGKVCKKFLTNISDKLLYFIDNDIKNCNADESKVTEAQKEILQIMVSLDIIKVWLKIFLVLWWLVKESVYNKCLKAYGINR